MNWRKVEIQAQQEAEEVVANILIEAGAQGVIVEGDRAIITLAAYYYDDQAFPDLFNGIKERLAKLAEFGFEIQFAIKVSITRDEDWSTSWHQFFKPLKAGSRFLICPDWEDCSDSERKVVIINPGMAFGIGGHQTTRMSIELLEKYADQKVAAMLDLGTGTGILAIIAAFLGVQAVTAIDLDLAAVAAARKNVELNGLAGIITIKQGDLIAEIKERFPLVIANLLPQIIIRLLPGIPKIIPEDGLLILSGIIGEKKRDIVGELNDLGFNLLEEQQEEEWVSLVARKG